MPWEICFDMDHDGKTEECFPGYDTKQDAEDDVDRLINLVPRYADAKVRICREGR